MMIRGGCFLTYKIYLHRLIKIFIIFFTSIALLSCLSFKERDLETTVKQEGEFISCSGYKSWSDCYKVAKKTCTNNYKIIRFEENLMSQNRYLRISCK